MRISDWSSDVCSSDLLPQLGHVEGLVDLALIGCAVAEISDADPAVPGVFVLERQPRADRHLRADDAVPAVEPVLHREHVHRAALAARNAGGAAGEFGHDDLGVDAIRSEEHTSELQSLMRSSYAVFCLNKKIKRKNK